MRTNVARGSLLGIAGQGWHLLTAFLLYAILARRLGPAAFGQWRVVISVLVWFELFINSGLIKVATKSISEARADRSRIERASYLGQGIIAAAAFIALEVLAPPIAALLGRPELAPLLRVSALDIPLYGAFMVASAIVLGDERYERQAVAWIIYATAKFVAIAVLVLAGFSLTGALVGNALSSIVGFAVVFAPWKKREGSEADVAALARVLMIAAVPFLALSVTEGLGQSADLWLVSAIVPSATAVGLYASATVLAEVPTFLFLGLQRVIFPSVARAAAECDDKLAGHYAMQGVRLAIIVCVFIVAIAASTGHQLLALVYSDAYAGAFVPLVLLMVAASGRTIRATCGEVLMARDRRRAALAVMAGVLVLEIALLAALAPRYGLVGAAAGVAAAALVGGLWSVALIGRQIGTRPLATLVRCAVSAALVGAGLVLFTPAAPLWLAAAYPLAAIAYAALLWVTREIGAPDVASLRRAFGR